MLRYIRISIYRQVIVVNPNKHLERRVKGTVQPGERIYVGVSLVDVKYPDLVVIVERVWATASTDPDQGVIWSISYIKKKFTEQINIKKIFDMN